MAHLPSSVFYTSRLKSLQHLAYRLPVLVLHILDVFRVVDIEHAVHVTDKPPVELIVVPVILERVEFCFGHTVDILAVSALFAALRLDDPYVAVLLPYDIIGIKQLLAPRSGEIDNAEIL